jgi:hypoxanthine-guanine phosphoribosyltransferase
MSNLVKNVSVTPSVDTGLKALKRPAERLVNKDAVERVWYSIFDPTKTEKQKEAALKRIEKAFLAYAHRSDDRKVSDEWMTSEDLSMVVSRLREPLINNVPKGSIVIPILTSGFPLGSEIMYMLDKEAKFPQYALLSCSFHTSCKYSFGNGERVGNQIYVPQPHLELLVQNRGKPVLLVDDWIQSGSTITRVSRYLKGMGFDEILTVGTATGIDLCYLLERVTGRIRLRTKRLAFGIVHDSFGPFW